MSWLDAIGAALTAGNNTWRRRTLEDTAEDERAHRQSQDDEEQAVRLALMEEDQQLQREQATRSQRQFDLSEADVIREALGPGNPVDDTSAEKLIAAYGQSAVTAPTLEARPFQMDPAGNTTQGAMTGGGPRTISMRPQEQTAQELQGMQLSNARAQQADLTAQAQARALVEAPDFASRPREQQDQLWRRAGYGGNRPLSQAEIDTEREKDQAFEREKLRTMYPPDRFGPDRGGGNGRDYATQEWNDLYQATLGRLFNEQNVMLNNGTLDPAQAKSASQIAMLAMEATNQVMPRPQAGGGTPGAAAPPIGKTSTGRSFRIKGQ